MRIIIILLFLANTIISMGQSTSEVDNNLKGNSRFLSLYNKTPILPLVAFNKNDGLHLGLIYYNKKSKNLSNWNLLIAPSYGIKSKKLVGLHQLSYTWPTPTKTSYKSIALGYEYKTYHYNNSKQKDLPRLFFRYHRIAPFIQIHLRNPNNKKLFHAISLKSIQLLKEQFNYAIGETELNYARIDRIVHTYINKNTYYPIDINTVLESHSYKNYADKKNHNLKLSTIIKTNIPYSEHKKVSLRLFAAGFLLTDTRSSLNYNDQYYINGSISLFSQGWSDYGYDGFYTDRNNQSNDLPIINRNQAGGFGVGLGSQYSRIGQSNNFAVALNTKVDLPFNIPYISMAIFLDMGIVSQATSYQSTTFTNTFLYSGGVELMFFDGGLEILFPIKSSEPIRNILREKGKYFNRISISIDVDQMRLYRNKKRALSF